VATSISELEAEPVLEDTRRRPFRRLMQILLLLIALILAGTWWSLSQIPRIPDLTAIEPTVGSGTFLLIGSDSRENLPEDLAGEFGSFAGQRSDLIMLARPSGGTLHLLSLPRDLKVDIPGHGINKINAAYAFGGPNLLAQTVTGATGLAIHHVVEIDFGGFAALVDSVGGINLEFPYAARDAKSGLDVAAGTTHIDGATALAFVRSRSYQEFRDGSWVSVDADDLGRTTRQQRALTALMGRIASPSGLVRGPILVGTLDQALSADENFGVINALATAFNMRSATVDGATLPVRFSNEGGVSYVVADGDKAADMLNRFASGAVLAEG